MLFWGAARKLADFVPEEAATQAPFYYTISSYKRRFKGRITASWCHEYERVARELRRSRRAGRETVLIMGASHLHTIVHGAAGDDYAVNYAYSRSVERGAAVSYSQVTEPNVTVPELLATYLAFRAADALPDWLVVGMVYDDIGTPGVRWTVCDICRDAMATMATNVGDVGVAELVAAVEEGAKEKYDTLRRSPTTGTPQEKLEGTLTQWAEEFWPGYRHRNKVRAFLIYRTVAAYHTLKQRDSAFGIGRDGSPEDYIRNPTRWKVQRIRDEVEKVSLNALDSLLSLSKADGVSTVLYIAPFPQPPFSLFHDREHVDHVHEIVKSRCATYGAEFLDFESLLDLTCFECADERRYGDYGLDCWHFNDAGHKRLGETIDAELERLIAEPTDAL